MKRIILSVMTFVVVAAMSTQAFAATQQEIKNAAKNPTLIKNLIAGKSAGEAADIVAAVLKEAIAAGGTVNEIKTAIASISAAAIAAAGDAAVQIAQALVTAAGSDYVAVTVASIKLAVGTADNAAAVVNAAIQAAGADNRAAALNAAANPVATLGETLAGIVVNIAATVTGGSDIGKGGGGLPPTGKAYEGQ